MGTATATRNSSLSLHVLGVICGLSAGAWLGAAEAPTKLVTLGISPFIVTFGMVCGVILTRWTVPMLLKGSGYLFSDLKENAHLTVWALLAGMLWAVANTLTVFAIRDVGLSIAFPLWNTNSLVGLFWGWLLFRELRGASAGQWLKVLGGATAIVLGAALLAMATAHQSVGLPGHAAQGIMAALGAGVLWGTMYIPFRKAYISGINPLSFVTVIAIGELLATLFLGLIFQVHVKDVVAAKSVLFWLFLGGFCWVFGDLAQQYAAKYIGIGRGIPLSNTNQLWGLAWGALVFGELGGMGVQGRTLVIVGSVIMIAGAVAISTASASTQERASWQQAVKRECLRYELDEQRVHAAISGEDLRDEQPVQRRWWEPVAALLALGVFVGLAVMAQKPNLAFAGGWMLLLMTGALALLVLCATMLYRRTRFS